MQNIIAIENGVTRHPLYRMKEPVNMTLAAGEHIAAVSYTHLTLPTSDLV